MKSSLCAAYITELIYFPPQNNSKYSQTPANKSEYTPKKLLP